MSCLTLGVRVSDRLHSVPIPIVLDLREIVQWEGGSRRPPFFDIVGFLSFSVVLLLSPCTPGRAGRGALTVNPFSHFFQGEPAVFGSLSTYPVNLRKMEGGSGYSNNSDIATTLSFFGGGIFVKIRVHSVTLFATEDWSSFGDAALVGTVSLLV